MMYLLFIIYLYAHGEFKIVINIFIIYMYIYYSRSQHAIPWKIWGCALAVPETRPPVPLVPKSSAT